MTIGPAILLPALLALLAGSGTAPARFCALTATAVAVLVEPVTVPAAVDRPELVVQASPNRVDVDEFNRWAAPLAAAIRAASAP